ncbi:hypothetical protein CPC08DRAFT_6196 [Agrocybe pediades]|nr:hypothetical protein CPC08DRAFT_6196 [Agrocybe pediades]
MSYSETDSDSMHSLDQESASITGYSLPAVSGDPFSVLDPRNSTWASNATLASIEDVHALLNLGVPLLVEKPAYIDDVLVAAARLLKFLTHPKPNEVGDDLVRRLVIFSALAHADFLRRLFEYRVFFRELNVQLVDGWTNRETWVDEFLAMLCLSIDFYVLGFRNHRQSSHCINEKILLQKKRMLSKASSQLPENWDDVKFALGCPQYSPAARRIAISLLFAAYIMAVRLNGMSHLPQTTFPIILDELFLTAQSEHAMLRDDSPEDRISASMLLSLIATSEKYASKSRSRCSKLRPEGSRYLLDLIRAVMKDEQESSSLHILGDLDTAQTILLKWGDVMPWSWSTWDDQRIAHTENLRLMVWSMSFLR